MCYRKHIPLQLNSRRLKGFLNAVFILLLICLIPVPVLAQDGVTAGEVTAGGDAAAGSVTEGEVPSGEVPSGIAYLLKGPTEHRGAPGIGRNLIPGFTGVYNFRGREVEVFFTYRTIPVFESWETLQAGRFDLYNIRDSRIFCYIHRENWTVFIEFPDRESADMKFLEIFTAQMIFFVRDGEGFSGSSFPAVIDIK